MIQDLYGPGLRKTERSVFRKPYPPWVDYEEFPRGYKIPKFHFFSGEDNQSTIEHVEKFTF